VEERGGERRDASVPTGPGPGLPRHDDALERACLDGRFGRAHTGASRRPTRVHKSDLASAAPGTPRHTRRSRCS
jgi:hypothetical protein